MNSCIFFDINFAITRCYYNNKKGDGIREYFHCENMNTIQEIKNMIDHAVGID